MNKLQKDILELEEQFRSNSCRICLTPDIHNSCNLINENLIKCIKFCTGIRINQDSKLPTQICKDCLSSIAVAYKFKNLCMIAEKICGNLLQNRTKIGRPEKCTSPLENGIEVDVPEINKAEVDDNENLNEIVVDGDCMKLLQNEIEVDMPEINKIEVDDSESLNILLVDGDCMKPLQNGIKVEMPEIKKVQVGDNQILVDGDCIKENFVNIDHTNELEIEKIVMDNNFNVNENEDVTYFIYDPGEQDNLLDEPVSHIDEDNSQIDMSESSSAQRESDESNAKVTQRFVFGPYSNSKLKRVKLYCKWCDMKFATKQEASVHRELVHKRRTSFTCQVCGKTFARRAAHYVHARSHLPPTFACDHCDYRTAVKNQLAVHLRIHAAGPRRYQCEQCPSAYHTPSNLLNHRRKVHERLKRYACHVCGKTFFTSTDLNDHLDTHNKIKR
ncbi:zinc finger protein 37 homolog isoform X1 [Bicyclus anynana]|uniref:Zinc finger protein 37 homolog isoform X1 n=1 Tax=Bicyclus anynana TaxID=110368 RepID=A0ABM3M3A8_BICAN|nr:zinc finger protein 37 homolog isoform X1 [Bicyclus anynana]